MRSNVILSIAKNPFETKDPSADCNVGFRMTHYKTMKSIIQKILRFLARSILKKYKPEVIAITGSVGKTSTKEAVYAVLKNEFHVRQSPKNYNTEIGVPVSIIGTHVPATGSIIGWMVVFLKGLGLIINTHNYPKILVLEMALDHPHDIEYLVNLAPPTLGVMTTIGNLQPVHVEFFKSIEELVQEKIKVVTRVPKKGFAIMNRDDERVWNHVSEVNSHIISYGFDALADIRAHDVRITEDFDNTKEKGIEFSVTHQDVTVPIFLPDTIGKHQIYPALAAIAVGRAYDMSLNEIAQALKKFTPLNGRMHILEGIKHTIIIDDSYNSSPVACKAAVETLGTIQTQHSTFAVLADMLELGKMTKEAHILIGKEVAKNKIDYLVTIGERSKDMAKAARDSGMDHDRIYEFSDAESAGAFVQERIEEGDIILVKGSQSMRTEKVTKEIMAEPLRAKELLVRQDKGWV